jgi:subtilisin family serine protease
MAPNLEQLARLRLARLADRRQDVAWEPADPDDADEQWFYRPGELLVRADALDRVVEALRRLGVRSRRCADEDAPRRVQRTSIVTLDIRSRQPIPRLLDRLDEQGLGEVVSANHIAFACPRASMGPATEPEEPRGREMLPRAADESAGKGVRVVVVDTGLLPEHTLHPPLQHDVLADVDDVEDKDVDGDQHIDPYAGHGTFIAGVIRSVAPAATVVLEQVLDDDGLVDEADLSRQLIEALASHPHVINLSLGFRTRGGRPPLGMVDVWRVLRRRARDCVIVASAGNEGSTDRFWPAAEGAVVGVAAVDAEGAAADFSNRGDWVKACALGVDIDGAYAEGTYRTLDGADVRQFSGLARWSGTSFAAPMVAGAIAARMSADGVSATEAWDRIRSEAGAGPSGFGVHVTT